MLKSQLRYQITSPKYRIKLREHLAKFYLLFWKPDYLFSVISEGTITHKGETYQVIWGLHPHQIKKLPQCSLSFRKPLPLYNMPSYVIISD